MIKSAKRVMAIIVITLTLINLTIPLHVRADIEHEEIIYTIDLTNTLKVTEKLSKLFIDNNSNDSPKPSGNGFKDSVDTNKMGTIEATYNHSYRQHDMSSTSDTDEYTNSNNAFLPQTGDNVSLSRLLIVSSLSLLTMIFIHRKRRS
ncbi:MAG: LPXTG cell wall anchor domain-containing protein [Lachnospiraceae bacterium]|jgi:LPXTG-motif cell wall-anchored protein|nr:LPXTG cell wall anchor domain-containing protein [Eubacterium sp.]MCI9105253.1 LPXTG cell wall anchor domain-containing protein [Lachnospiraceae bacterium]